MILLQSFGSTPFISKWDDSMFGLIVELPSLTRPKWTCKASVWPSQQIVGWTEIEAHNLMFFPSLASGCWPIKGAAKMNTSPANLNIGNLFLSAIVSGDCNLH